MSYPMMPIAIDPTERRAQAPSPTRPAPRGAGRPILLAGLGCAGIVGLSILANTMLSGLAGPTPVRTLMVSRAAADMPDLRDGVPALVTSGVAVRSSPPSSSLPIPPEAAATPTAPSPVVGAPPRAETSARLAETAAVKRVVAAAEPAPMPRVETKPVPKPSQVPPIENAALVPPARVAPSVAAARPVALVTPSPKETTRARPAPAVSTSFAALPAEPAAHEAPAARKKPAPVVAVRTKPAAARVADAGEAPTSAASEPEETEVFGLKVPSLAPAGRKLVEGVQAFGDAVRDLPSKF